MLWATQEFWNLPKYVELTVLETSQYLPSPDSAAATNWL